MATETTETPEAQIAQLRTEAGEAGDRKQVAICDAALGGDEQARVECGRAIARAQRMAR